MLELRNLVKSYEGTPLLRGISFTVSQGETICLLGASGSGKSTILRMIAGLDFPDRGAILLNNIDLAQTPPHLRDFGLVFQDYGLFPHLNVFDNIAFGLRMKSIKHKGHEVHKGEIDRRVYELLAQVNLVGFDSRKVTDLSGGEQQRVALARALAPQPRLLMFDEPLGALDRSLKEDLLNELRAILHQTKIPAIYVTHDQEEAFAIADRILVLHDGIIIRDAVPHEIWREPQSAVVAKLLGIGNVIEGEVVEMQNAEGGMQNVKTEFGVFAVECSRLYQAGERVSLLVQQPPSPSGRGARGEGEIQLTVEDVLFKQDQFQVKGRGGLVVHMKDAPRVGQVIRVKVQVKCLA
ncbi:MAG: ABC transporter ATP-binding protein [Chloroflexi bacterium]|nr:ABC transporter ATP-binding protein [Chloroflexota bacterium]